MFKQPRRWARFLIWEELCYNTKQHSSTKMTPYEATFEKSPPTLEDYSTGNSQIEAVAELQSRTDILNKLNIELAKTQKQMTLQANKHRRHEEFEVGT